MTNKQYIIENLKIFKENQKSYFGILSIGLFGSYARGENRSVSDIDIFVETETPNPFNLVHLKDALELIFNKKVDIVRIRSNMNQFLKSRIEKEGIYV